MKRVKNILILLLLGFFFNCSEDKVDVIGYGTITGRVVVASSFEPIENAKVAISPTNNTVFTDEEGYFKMEGVEAGDYSVSATKEDFLTTFVPATVTEGTEVNVIIEMDDDDALNKPPSAPVLHSPEDGSVDQELSIQLIWSSEDPDDDELTYRIELKNDYDNDIINIEEVVDTSYVVESLKYGVKYFWQVAASDDVNPEVFSNISSFKTKSNPANRYLFVRKSANDNNVIISSNFNEDDDVSENEVQLTEDNSNSWRPRKNLASGLIAFLRTSNNETHLFTMNPDGTNISQVTSAIPIDGINLNEIDFAWSSNGDRIIYPNYDKLYVINKDGSGLQQIYQTTDGSFITECDWSYDESIIALKTNDISGYNVNIYTIDASGTVLKNILSGVSGAAGGLNLSIDNKKLLYTYDVSGFEDLSYRQLDSRIFIYNFEDDSVEEISTGKTEGTIDLDPRFSPNEAEIIFVNTSNDGISPKTVYKVSVDGSDNRAALFENAVMPDWE